ncbi:recombinase family protein [Kitasatospora sp. NPDC087861]|uniref:recombinase family protein n=1 Tax=Kitasatospora sp. NPDC087861 TaxID=3364070 RepID=UPI0037F3F433
MTTGASSRRFATAPPSATGTTRSPPTTLSPSGSRPSTTTTPTREPDDPKQPPARLPGGRTRRRPDDRWLCPHRDRPSPVTQISTLLAAGAAEKDIYVERANGHKSAWPEHDLLLPRLRAGDTLKITRLDRLFYSVQNLVVLGTGLRNRGVRLQRQIDSESLDGRDLFGMLAILADLNVQFVAANTNDGLASARVRGRIGGCPSKLTDHQVQDLIQQHADGARVPALAKKFKVSQSTVYRLLNLSHLETQISGNRS